MRTRTLKSVLAGGVCALALTTAAHAENREFAVPAGELSQALDLYIRQSGEQLIYRVADVRGIKSPGVSGALSTEEALARLLEGTSLTIKRDASGLIAVASMETQAPQSGSAAGGGAEVEALIVTAQKREEDIQDVPIAISAFSQEDLTRSQIAGGPDLITQVPNMTFTKTNFSSYSIQLRGIGTQAISATVDPAVAVAFNNTPFIRNRFFEQEFYDLQRVEVLRGPQGTLYGRNATAGVVNLISAKPKFYYEAKASADVANYSSTRIEGMVNVPLVEDVVALRLAGAWTKRDGYATNELTGAPIDGRDLWSTRMSLRFAPNDRIDANLIWEHFEEDDDRIRSGKQLCDTDIVTEVAGIPTPDFYQLLRNYGQDSSFVGVQSTFSQGCLPTSLYSPESFQKANSLALPYYAPLGVIHLPIARIDGLLPADPYASRTQSQDLRVIEAAVDPGYRAKTDIVELQVNLDLSDSLTLSSETSWASDFIFSTQDYNRFAGAPGAWRMDANALWYSRGIINADGEFCDPQIGCSDRLTAMDLSTAKSAQFSQELRLASDFDGPFNFSLGANYLRYDTEDKYYVFINSISMLSAYLINGLTPPPNIPYEANITDNRTCLPYGMVEPEYSEIQPIARCTYIDPNPVENLNDLGHNYFLSRNPYKLISYAAFGEAYYNLAENLKVTAGLRWTVDKKEAPLIPSWIFAASTVGHPVVDTIEQEWREPTGRLAIDWKPDLAFTDETMVYASYAHGYKAGGMNPPPFGATIYGAQGKQDIGDALAAASAVHPKTFAPEFIDAFEIGAKNTLLGGAVTLNLAGFYYDYQGYQLSQIVDRAAITQNFDADIWGIELEADWRPVENLRLGLKLGYEETKVADGEQAIDVMDRTAGNEDWVLVRPFPTLPTNCVLPAWLFLGQDTRIPGNLDLVDVGGKGGGNVGGCEHAYLLNEDPAVGSPYMFDPYAPSGLKRGEYFRTGVDYASWSTDRDDYPCLPAGADPATMTVYPGVDPECLAALSNNGEGFFKDLSGNELPNAPNFTATITADYTVPLASDWLMTLHTDFYYQAESWWRIFNTPGYDKLKAYTNVNLAAIFTNDVQGWNVMAYVKNVFDKDHITGAFLNSDDTGLTTNVFLIEPRLYGIRVTKAFDGGPWWTGADPESKGPFPLTVELGGQVQRHDAPYEDLGFAFIDNLDAALDPTAGLQNRDLDWGDGRSAKLTYRPAGSLWSVSGGVRYGRTNNETARGHRSADNIETICGAVNPFQAYIICDPASPYYDLPEAAGLRTVNKRQWADAATRSREEHTVVDFSVGRDFGLGAGIDSAVSGGLRYAELESRTHLFGQAQSGWDIPVGWIYYDSSFYRYEGNIDAERTFKGTGPMLSWDGAVALLGDDQTGYLKAAWSVGAAALFGKQETSFSGSEQAALYVGRYTAERLDQSGDPVVLDPPQARTRSVTVPVVDLSLGLSYDVGRIVVGAGYRWERYFDALDVGFDEAKDADRTIDGPYFKLSVGFGG